MTEEERKKLEKAEWDEIWESVEKYSPMFQSKPKQATDALEPSDMTQEKDSKYAPTMDKTTNEWDINGEKIPVTIRRIRCGYAITKRAKKIATGCIPAPISTFVLTNVTPQTATTASASKWYCSFNVNPPRIPGP